MAERDICQHTTAFSLKLLNKRNVRKNLVGNTKTRNWIKPVLSNFLGGQACLHICTLRTRTKHRYKFAYCIFSFMYCDPNKRRDLSDKAVINSTLTQRYKKLSDDAKINDYKKKLIMTRLAYSE